MDKKRPLGITLIGYFYVFGTIALIVTLFTDVPQQFGVALRFGVPNVPENAMRTLLVAVSLILAYGYLRLEKWG